MRIRAAFPAGPDAGGAGVEYTLALRPCPGGAEYRGMDLPW